MANAAVLLGLTHAHVETAIAEVLRESNAPQARTLAAVAVKKTKARVEATSSTA